MYVTDLYSECIAGKLQFVGELLSVLNLLLFIKMMVSQYQISISWRQLLQAFVKSVG